MPALTRRRKDRWRDAVLGHRSPGMNGEVRALLLYLSYLPEMSSDAIISMPQKKLVEAFGVPKSRISERIKRAHDLGLLTTIEAGCPGRTAVYQGTIPGDRGTTGLRGPLGSVATELTVPSDSNCSTSSVTTEPISAELVPSRRGATVGTGFRSLDSEPEPDQPALGLDESSSSNPGPEATATDQGNAPRTNPITVTTRSRHDEQQHQLRALEELIAQEAS